MNYIQEGVKLTCRDEQDNKNNNKNILHYRKVNSFTYKARQTNNKKMNYKQEGQANLYSQKKYNKTLFLYRPDTLFLDWKKTKYWWLRWLNIDEWEWTVRLNLKLLLQSLNKSNCIKGTYSVCFNLQENGLSKTRCVHSLFPLPRNLIELIFFL